VTICIDSTSSVRYYHYDRSSSMHDAVVQEYVALFFSDNSVDNHGRRSLRRRLASNRLAKIDARFAIRVSYFLAE